MKKLPEKKSLLPEGVAGEFYQMFKKYNTNSYTIHTLFQEPEDEGTLPN
jgi:hypothetical protein